MTSYSSPIHSAVPVVAAKVSLPKAAGTASLLDLLPPHLASVYSDPQLLLRPTPARCKAQPRCLFADREEYVALVRRLTELGMVTLRTSAKVVNGLFTVP